MMTFSDSEHPMSLEKLPAEWLDMLVRQVEWAINEVDEMIPADFPETSRDHYELLFHQLNTFQERLTLERIRRFAVFLDKQFHLGTPQIYLDEQKRKQQKKQEQE